MSVFWSRAALSVRTITAAAVAIALVALAGTASLVSAAPAAKTTPADYGATLQCNYRAPGPGIAYQWRLKRIVMDPPVMNAKSNTQTVGWQYVVRRSLNPNADPWKVTYRSPIQKASASTTKAAQFTKRSVEVALPKVDNVGFVEYQVTLKMFWYKHGAVQSTVSYLMPDMVFLENGHDYGDGDAYDNCPGGFYQGP